MRTLFPALVALGGLLALTFVAAFSVVILSSGSCGQSTPRTKVVLSYVVDLSKHDPNTPVDLAELAIVINRRINRGRKPIAEIRAIDTGSPDTDRIEIGVYSNDPDVLQRIKRLLARTGTFELRILANQGQNEALVKRALSSDADVLIDDDGSVLAWWVPVLNHEILQQDEYPMYMVGYPMPEELPTTRTQTQDGLPVTEVLAIEDRYDITASFLESATADRDSSRGPLYVSFVLTPAGASRLAALTNANLPNVINGTSSQLGIIVDGRVVSAQTIETALNNRGTIVGPFNEEEIEDMADVLNSGPLPVPIELIDTRFVEE